MNNRKAFTLIEVIVILAVLGILAGLAVPAALRIFEVTAEEATRDEMGNIKRAILGDARKLQSFFRSDFGYLGDIGCLPDDLRRILFNPPSQPPVIPALPTWNFDPVLQTGAGWKGPYITGATIGQEVEEFTRDQWGNDYTYTVTGGPCPPTPMTATLTSGGADLTSAADDITLTIEANETTATVRGTVKDTAGVGVASVAVELYSAASNGTLTTTTATTDANGNYTFTSVPFGQRAVRAVPNLLLLVSGSVTTQSNGEDVIFTIINYSASPITITSITATWSPFAGTQYDNVRINGAIADACNNIDSGENCNINPDFTVNASPTPSASMRVTVDSPDTLLPDIRLTSGTAATFTLEFENNDDMRNRNFTVQLFHTAGGPSTVQFVTPP